MYHDAKDIASFNRQGLSVKTDINEVPQERHATAKVHYGLICEDEVSSISKSKFRLCRPSEGGYIYMEVSYEGDIARMAAHHSGYCLWSDSGSDSNDTIIGGG